MDLPDGVKLRGIFVQGGVFKAQLAENHDRYPRYYFVLNASPNNDTYILLSTTTTQFEQHRNCISGDDVHIPLSPVDYPELRKECLICCDRPVPVSAAKLKTQLALQNYVILKPLPSKIVKEICKAIGKSKVVATRHKKLVLGEE